MAKSKKTGTSADLVTQALLQLAQAHGPVRLVGKGDSALFASAAGANRDAIVCLKDENEPLIAVLGEGKEQTVELTTAGFGKIAAQLSKENWQVAVARVAKPLPAKKRIAFYQELLAASPTAITELLPLLDEAIRDEKSATERHTRELETLRREEAAMVQALERWKSLLNERKRERIRALKQELHHEGVDAEESPSADRMIPQAKASSHASEYPADKKGADFRRQMARRLVSSWVEAVEANKPEAREFLEAAIWNISGFRMIGEVGQSLNFDGAFHEGEAGLFTNDRVRVLRPGWVLEEQDGNEYIVVKAQVAKA